VSLQVTDGHNERVWAVWLALNDELCHDNGMVGCAAERANPPLGGSEMG
jgi:hypothetical protein